MRHRALTIVVVDHGFYTDLRRTSGLPENDNIWTAAVFAGPAQLIGTPRRLAGPASLVDMMPTIPRSWTTIVGRRRSDGICLVRRETARRLRWP